MADDPEVVTIYISGLVADQRNSGKKTPKRQAIDPGAANSSQTNPPPPPPPPPPPDADQDRKAEETKRNVESLNAAAGEICGKIERQIKRLLGSDVSVQAELSFSVGSIVIEGAVSLLFFSGSIFGEALKKELGELVRVPIKRILAEAMTDLGVGVSGLEIEASVRSRPGARAPARAAATLQLPVWTNLALIVAALGIVFLVADRLASEWPARPVPALAASHPPAP